MKYRLRNFENNLQILNSAGWVLVVVSLIGVFAKQQPGILLMTLIGAGLIWLQLRGRRIVVDTANKTVLSDGLTHSIKSADKLYINEVKVRQRVNSRAQSANISTYFYKAYMMIGEEKILISSNRKEGRDMKKLQAIAKDLNIALIKNY